MLKLSQCEIRVSRTRNIAAGVTSLEEGIALIAVREGGEMKVKAAAGGSNNDEFAGIALNERTAPALFPYVGQFTVANLGGGNYGFVLPKAIVGTPQLRYDSNNTALTLDAGSTFDAGEYQVSGTTILVNSADLAKKINVIFSYSPNTLDLMYLGGDNSPTTFAPITSFIGATSVIEAGTVFTSNYDVTIDWANWTPASALKAVANGIISTTGTGATINRGRVIQAPTADLPYLGIDFSVA